MERTIIHHDVETAKARVKFEHAGVVFEDDFNLKAVIPGSEYTFAQMGIEFDETYQIKALDRLALNIEKMIDDGVITNPPEIIVVENNENPELSEEASEDEVIVDAPEGEDDVVEITETTEENEVSDVEE